MESMNKLLGIPSDLITFNAYMFKQFDAMRFEFQVVFNYFNPIYTFWNTKRET